jgi:hypothetical protein
MLFRLGGLFILCVVGAAILSRFPLFATISPGTAVLATLGVYILLAVIATHRYRRRLCAETWPVEGSFPPWPTRRSRHRALSLALLVPCVALAISAYVAYPGTTSNALASSALAIFGLLPILLSFYAVRHGYFPSSHKGRGVSRYSDPPQFWVTAAMYLAFGLLILFAAFRSVSTA